jgi:hypothetical protein
VSGAALATAPGDGREPLLGHVLERRRSSIERLEPLFDQPLVVLGLSQMLAKHECQLGILDAVRAGSQGAERVLLSRMHVGEVLDQLILQRILGHTASSSAWRPGPASKPVVERVCDGLDALGGDDRNNALWVSPRSVRPELERDLGGDGAGASRRVAASYRAHSHGRTAV